MKRFLNHRLTRLLPIFLLVFGLALVPQVTQAFSLLDVSLTGLVSGVMTLLLYSVASVLGGIVTIEAWIVTIILSINFQIVDTQLVGRGFDASLSIVNLGFVLGLIIIAMATILRWEGYGLKNTIRNFVVAALLVNFSLVIAGTMIRASDGVTLYLIQSGFNENPDAGFIDSVDVFAEKMTRAFAPQQYFNPQEKGRDPNALLDVVSQQITDPVLAEVSTTKKFVIDMLSFGMMVLGLLLTVVTFASLIVMLLYRYVMLAGLLIVMPFAWLLWIFPSTSHYWKRWWEQFIRQAFFTPVAIFGIWLVTMIGTDVNVGSGSSVPFLANAQQSAVYAGLQGWGGSVFAELLMVFVNGLLLNFLMISSLRAASTIGGRSAEVGVRWAEGMKNSYVGYVGNRSRRIANRAYEGRVPTALPGVGGRSLKGAIGGLQNVGSKRIPGVSWLAGRAARGVDRVTEANRETVLNQARESAKNLSIDHKINNINTATFPDKLAWLEDIKKEGRLGDVKNLESILGDTDSSRDAFRRYDKGKLYGEARDESGLTYEKLRKEVREIETSDKYAGDETKRLEEKEKKLQEIGRYLSGMKDPHKVVRMYFGRGEHDMNDAEKAKLKAEGKKVPLAPNNISSKNELNEARQLMLKTMTQHMSSKVVSKALKEVTLKDEEQIMKEVGKALRDKEKAIQVPAEYAYNEKNISKGLKSFFTTTGAKELGINYESIGLQEPIPTAGQGAGGQGSQNQYTGNQGNQNQTAGNQGNQNQQTGGQNQQAGNQNNSGPQIIPPDPADTNPNSSRGPATRWDADGNKVN